MKKYSNRFLSLALAAVMVVSTALPAFAEDAPLNAAGQDAAVEAQADAAAQAAAQVQAEAEAQAAAQAAAQAQAEAEARAAAQAAAQAQAEAEAQVAAQAAAQAQAEAEAQAAAQAETEAQTADPAEAEADPAAQTGTETPAVSDVPAEDAGAEGTLTDDIALAEDAGEDAVTEEGSAEEEAASEEEKEEEPARIPRKNKKEMLEEIDVKAVINKTASFENGTYSISGSGYTTAMIAPDESDFKSYVVVNGDTAYLITNSYAPNKYDAVWKGKRSEAPADPSSASVVMGTMIADEGGSYAASGSYGGNVYEGNKAVQFVIPFPVSELCDIADGKLPGLYFVLRRAPWSPSSPGSWMGSKDQYFVLGTLTKTSDSTALPSGGSSGGSGGQGEEDTYTNGTYSLSGSGYSTAMIAPDHSDQADYVVIKGEAAYLVVRSYAPNKYDAVWKGKRSEAPADAASADVIEGHMIADEDGSYASSGSYGSNVYEGNKAVEFIIPMTKAELKDILENGDSKLYFVLRRAPWSPSSPGSWMGSKDQYYDLGELTKMSDSTALPTYGDEPEEPEEPVETTYSVKVSVVDSSTNKAVSGASVTVTGPDGKAVNAEAGAYTLTEGKAYTIKVTANGYEDASQKYTASKDETVTVKLTKSAAGKLKIVKNAAMFKVVSASLEGSGSNKKLRIALSGEGYQYLYKGSKEDAAVSKASERIKGKKNAAGKWEFVIPVTAKDGTFALAALSVSKNAWYDRTIILDQKKMTISTESADPTTSVPVPDGEDWRGDSGKQKEAEEAKKKEAESYKDASNVGTSAVNNSTTLTDGTYGPSNYSFSFSGGTGKVVIVCTQVVVRGGQAYATIKFQKPNGKASSVDTVRANGSVYGGNNVFEIPVQLNANNTIVARTTAMSQPHWIEYKIFINMKEPGKDSGSGVGKDTKTMDDEAPEIVGLTVKDETEVVYSDRFKIFNYEDGIYLIEVDMISDTAREDAEEDEEAADETDAAEPAEDASTSAAAAAGDGISTAEEEAAPAVSESAETAELYTHDIVKYLVVPSDAEIPAGLSKEVIVIEQPVDKTYVSSVGALELLSDIGVLDDIRTIGVEEKDITVDSVLEALEPRDPDGVPLIEFGGTYDDWDLKSMIIKQTNFAVQSSAFLPKDEKTFDDDMENFERLTNRSAQMGFACFVDRSEDEENDLARAEWYKVYGIIFNKLKEGEAAYKKVVDAASASEKKAALDLLKKRAEERKVRLDDEAEEEADD